MNRIKLKRWNECQTEYSPYLCRVDYSAYSTSFPGFAVKDHGSDIFRNISAPVDYISSPGGAGYDQKFDNHLFENCIANMEKWSHQGHNKMSRGN